MAVQSTNVRNGGGADVAQTSADVADWTRCGHHANVGKGDLEAGKT